MRKNHCLDSQAPSPTHHVTAAVRGHISRSTASLPPLASPGAQGARRADAASWQRPAGAGRRPRRLGHAAQPGFGACCAPRACAARAGAPEPPLDELLWTVAVARLLFGPAMGIQAPPNLTPAAGAALR